jgi:orotate phosphoribosyltransferase
MVNYGVKLANEELRMNVTKLEPEDPFLWASKFWMPIYNDNRMLLYNPRTRRLIAQGFESCIERERIRVDVVAGTSTAGIPHGAILAERLNKPFIYIREKPKDHGMRNQIEGIDADSDLRGKRVLVVEDLISTGGSSAKAVDAVRKANGRVDYLFSIFNYALQEANNMFDGVAAFDGSGATLNPAVNVRSLLTYDTLLEVAVKSGHINRREQRMLEEWRADPFGWGAKHGYHWMRGREEKRLSRAEKRAKGRFILAADVPSTRDAFAYADGFSDLIGMIKIGKATNQAAVNEGVPLLRKLHQTGMLVFLDLKLKDTPDQVYLAAKQCTVPGVYMFNVHVDGSEKMCREAVRGATEAAAARGIERPKVIGVTALTSLDDDDLSSICINEKFQDHVMHMAKRAKQWGLDGIVCPASFAGKMEKKFGEWEYVTPGIKWAGVQNIGQKQLDTPDGSVQKCSHNRLVIGSAVTKSADPRKTAYEILQAMAPHV